MRPRVLACRHCLMLSIGHVHEACACGKGLLFIPDAHYYRALQDRDDRRTGHTTLPTEWLVIIVGVGILTGALVAWWLG